MRRPIQPPPKVNPPRLPDYLFEPSLADHHLNGISKEVEILPQGSVRNPVDDTIMENERTSRKFDGQSGHMDEFERDVAEQMKAIEMDLRLMLEKEDKLKEVKDSNYVTADDYPRSDPASFQPSEPSHQRTSDFVTPQNPEDLYTFQKNFSHVRR